MLDRVSLMLTAITCTGSCPDISITPIAPEPDRSPNLPSHPFHRHHQLLQDAVSHRPLHIAVLPELYRPAMLSNPNARIQSYLGRAKDHLAQIEENLVKLNAAGDGEVCWNEEHEKFVFEKKWRLGVCLDNREVLFDTNSQTGIKTEVQTLRTHWQDLNQALGYMPSHSK